MSYSRCKTLYYTNFYKTTLQGSCFFENNVGNERYSQRYTSSGVGMGCFAEQLLHIVRSVGNSVIVARASQRKLHNKGVWL